jgi:biopolymer transport protein ExbB/TolQ
MDKGGRRSLTLEFVDRAACRAVASSDHQLKRGLSWLASISSTSFMVGLSGTAGQMITRTFYSCGGSWTSCNMPIGGRLSFGLGFGAVGLLVSLVSFLGNQYLIRQVEKLNLEMNIARLDLLLYLSQATVKQE